MGFRAGVVIVFLSFFCTVAMPVVAQSRTNTKAAGEKILKEAEKKRTEAERLQKEADAARARAERLKKSLKAREQRIANLDREIAEIEKHDIALLTDLVKRMMEHPKAGPILRQDPGLVPKIPEIKQLLQKQSWLAPHLEKILDEYRKPIQ